MRACWLVGIRMLSTAIQPVTASAEPEVRISSRAKLEHYLGAVITLRLWWNCCSSFADFAQPDIQGSPTRTRLRLAKRQWEYLHTTDHKRIVTRYCWRLATVQAARSVKLDLHVVPMYMCLVRLVLQSGDRKARSLPFQYLCLTMKWAH